MADPTDPAGGRPPGGRGPSEAEVRSAAARIEAEERLAESGERRVRNLERQKEQLTEQIALANKLKAAGDSLIGIDKQHLELQQELIELKLREEALDALHKKIRAGETELDAARAENDRDRIAALEKVIRLDKIKAGNDLANIARDRTAHGVKEAGSKSAEKWLKNILGYDQQFALLGERILDPVSGLSGAMGKLKAMNPAAMIGTVAMKSMELAAAQDQAVVNFRKATGASGEFDGNIRGLERSLYTAGVSSAEAGQAVQSLFLNVTDFTKMSETERETIGKTVAVLNELGVASETVAKNMQFATKAMGMSVNQAEELQRELFTFAQDLGVSADRMASDFASMGPQIAALGDKGVDAFRELEVQAKNTGLALTEILGLVEKFDKFDSAAQAVGKLNALLGGPYLNTMELVAETDPSKRFEILKDRIDAAGLSFDDMDYYQRKAMASAMGLNEQQLALMMRGSLDLIKAPAKSAADIEALAAQSAQFTTVMEELAQIGKGLMISLGPVVSIFKDFLQLISPITENLNVLIPALVTYKLAMKAAAFEGVGAMITSLKALKLAEMKTLLIGGLAIFLPLIASLGKSFTVLAVGLGIVTAAVIALGTAEKMTVILGVVGIVISGIAALVHHLTIGNSPSLVEAFYMVAAAIPFMSLALLGLMPLLPALLLLIPPLALGFAMIASTLTDLLSDQFVTNLQLMAVEIANIVDKINELSTQKAMAFAATAVVTGTAAAGIGLTSAALATIGLKTERETTKVTEKTTATTAAAAPPPQAIKFEGPPPTININLSIDGKAIATTINSIEVSKYTGGKKSSLYDSIMEMITQGLATGI